jgi:hypothetical protein
MKILKKGAGYGQNIKPDWAEGVKCGKIQWMRI